MVTLLVLIFVVGYALIALEHPLKLDKTVPALLAGALVWTAISVGQMPVQPVDNQAVDVHAALSHHVAAIAEILFFLIGAMVIVELIDLHRGFDILTARLKIRNKRAMLWLVCWLAFFLSAILDNLTCTIVFITVLRRLISERNDRLLFVGLVVVAANAGGAWSPIGDVTTTMLWIGQKLTPGPTFLATFLPSVVCLLVPLLVIGRQKSFRGENRFLPFQENEEDRTRFRTSLTMLVAGMAALIFVPVFKMWTHLPPWLGMMISMSFVWILSEYFHPEEDMHHEDTIVYKAKHALSRIEFSSLLFFLGILLAIGGLESTGLLAQMAGRLSEFFPDHAVLAVIFGGLSAVIDNVPIVAASIGMFPFPMDDSFWHLLAFTAGTGGSMLIIGSAAGVAAMGLENIPFGWYLKKIGWLAAAGFFAGVAVYLLMNG